MAMATRLNKVENLLLISSGSFIPFRDLEETLKKIDFVTKFDRIFVNKGLGGPILGEIVKHE